MEVNRTAPSVRLPCLDHHWYLSIVAYFITGQFHKPFFSMIYANISVSH